MLNLRFFNFVYFEKMAEIKVKLPDSIPDFRINALKGIEKYLFGG